jgi:glycosyltransferase involved in cell wall biosynthesis
MLTLNEEEFIRDALSSVLPFVDDTIVIDQRSHDDTAQIALDMGCRVMNVDGNFSTKGERWFRDLAARTCQTDWMMIIDADEALSDGWHVPIREFINVHGDKYGAIEIHFYHLMASYEFHTTNSPLWRPCFIRRHPGLCGSPPMEGSFAHSSYYLSYQPNLIKYLDCAAKIFHQGYLQRDLMKRWRTNIGRNDYKMTPEEAAATLERFEQNPFIGFPEVVPMTIPLSQYPTVLQPRVGKTYNVEYNAETKRILSRTPIP